MEIAETDGLEYRQRLKTRKRLLQRLIGEVAEIAGRLLQRLSGEVAEIAGAAVPSAGTGSTPVEEDR